LRRTTITVGGSKNIPMVEQAPFATTSERIAKILYLVEKHVLGRTPPEVKSAGGATGTGTGTGTKKPDEVE
jgi:hypothetical protein